MRYYIRPLVFSVLLCCVHSQRYIAPEATAELLSPRGLKISIPERPQIIGNERPQNTGRPVILDDQFNSMDGWIHQVSIGGSYPEDEFTCFTNDPENSYLQNGRLVIKPTLMDKKYNETFVREGLLRLKGCTSKADFCQRKAIGFSILPPVASARLTNNIRFRYGTVEIKAKFPRGDWLVSELWLVPANSDPDEKVVVGVYRGNTDGRGHQLGAGIVRVNQPQLMTMMESASWSQDFHTFRLEWTREDMRFFVDNRQIHRIPTGNFSVLAQEVYVSLGVHVGGDYDFPDEMYRKKPWRNNDAKRMVKFYSAKDEWYGTWDREGEDSALQVEYVKITAL